MCLKDLSASSVAVQFNLIVIIQYVIRLERFQENTNSLRNSAVFEQPIF